ncbi:enoyl-CoA hydratase/isomerase family protein [Fundicoccus sp. Sow4_F4]|uniref:enoyl-CoA hydratase/isomerase family protein n=1 Tax=Fundicoccus sp. Sow4_F4 TaxID=3438783 RepID=UPI003F91F1E5
MVKVTKEGHISYLSLDSPANLNAMGLGIVSDLLAALIEAEADPGTQVIVINSTGKFSAGGDLVSLNKQAKAQDADTLKELVEAVADVILYIKKMTKIVISSVNSAPAGAGFSLALASDMIIVADNAKFLTTFVSVGLVSDGGILYLLSKAIESSRELKLSITGRSVTTDEGLELGLVAYRNLKALNYTANYSELERYLKEETVAQSQAVLSDQFIEGTDAFIAKRKPNFSNN